MSSERMFAFNLQPDELEKLKGLPYRMDDRIKKVVFKAANSAAYYGKKIVIKAVTEELNLAVVHGKTGEERIGRQIRIDRAKNPEHPQADVIISRRPVKLSYFGGMNPAEMNPSVQRIMRGTQITVRRGRSEMIKHAFVAQLKSGHVGIFKRAKGSKKIQEQFGPTVVGIVAHNPKVREAVTNRVMTIFKKKVTTGFQKIADELKAGGG